MPGLFLSRWLRRTGHARLSRSQPSRLRTAADLDRFFAYCDADDLDSAVNASPEPEWDPHLATIQASRVYGLPTP